MKLSAGVIALFTLSAFQVKAQKLNFATGTGALGSISTGDGNTAVGEYAGASTTTSSQNVLIGTSAGRRITTGASSDNTYIGFDAGAGGVTNAFLGTFAADSTTYSSSDNTVVGAKAGRHLSTANDNTLIGSESGENLSTGDDNTFVGERAGRAVRDGAQNVCIGESACAKLQDGDDNTAVGYGALGGCGTSSCVEDDYAFQLNGYSNTAVGNEAMYDLRGNAGSNTALGTGAGEDLGEAYCNTFLGRSSGLKTEGAGFNTVVGAFSGDDNDIANTGNANANTYVGFATGRSNRYGELNVIVGSFSDFGSDYPSLALNNTDLIAACQSNSNGQTLEGQMDIAVNANRDQEVGQVSALGSRIDIRGDYGVAIGYEATMRGEGSIAIGASANVQNQAQDSIVLGRGAYIDSNADNAVAIGAYSTVAAHNSIAQGPDGSDGTTKMNVGIGTSAPNQYASLDLDDNSKGLLLNRLNDAEVATLDGVLSSEEAGLLIFNADDLEPQFWNGTDWTSLGASTATDGDPTVTAYQTLSRSGDDITLSDQ